MPSVTPVTHSTGDRHAWFGGWGFGRAQGSGSFHLLTQITRLVKKVTRMSPIGGLKSNVAVKGQPEVVPLCLSMINKRRHSTPWPELSSDRRYLDSGQHSTGSRHEDILPPTLEAGCLRGVLLQSPSVNLWYLQSRDQVYSPP